ncbi:polymer-forming cytoskeletal protein [Variovorax sp. LjRoot175]|uniref:bactofilin family protein n=1 Tax=Variovorax sp. LjRoot175 TaxID=3342276 RepID=UPI003ECF9742
MNGSSNSHSNDIGAIPAFLSKGETTRTVIGAESNFMGDISIRAGQDLHIEGCVVGNVFHGGKVVVADSGIVIGSIFAAHLEIHGVVDAPEGEILAANLVVHGTSRVTASEVTVTAGCMNYERGGYMSAQMGMLSESEVNTRIETLLQGELNRALERRVAIEQTRNSARDLRAARAAAPDTAPAAAASVVAEVADQAVVSESAAAQAPAAHAPVAAPAARPAIALVPSIVETDESAEAQEPARAYAG